MTAFTKLSIIVSVLITLVLFILVPTLGDLNGMYQEPVISSGEFLANQPHELTSIFGKEVWFTQPSSTAMVWALGILTALIGLYFVIARRSQKSRLYWGISLILWGLAAILAGVSYQAFGYELKARGQDAVLFTSWFEIFYMLIQAYSTAFMLSAVGYSSSTSQKFRNGLNVYASVFAGVYTLIMLVGIMVKNTFMISYTGFIVFAGYNYLIMFILSCIHFGKYKDKLNLKMIIMWISFLLVNVFYFVDLYVGDAIATWKTTGLWFTENDTLHVLLMGWMVEILLLFVNSLHDQNAIE